MLRRLAVLATVLLSIPAVAAAQSPSLKGPIEVSSQALARIRAGVAATPPAASTRLKLSVVDAGLWQKQPTAAEWQKEFDQATALRRKSNNVMKLGLVLAGVGALSAFAAPNAKGQMGVIMATPGLGIATWGYLARRKGDRELARLESIRPADFLSPSEGGR